MNSTADLRGPFEMILYRAWKLSEDVKEPWCLKDALSSTFALMRPDSLHE